MLCSAKNGLINLLFVLLWIMTTSGLETKINTTFTIQNEDTKLLLDASENVVKAKTPNGSPFQLWELVPAIDGTFYIKNIGNGKVLEATETGTVITSVKDDKPTQRWHLNPSGSTMVNAVGNNAVDAKYGSGKNLVVLWAKNNKPCQVFKFIY